MPEAGCASTVPLAMLVDGVGKLSAEFLRSKNKLEPITNCIHSG